MKGAKTCPKCSKSVGPRSAVCKYCNHDFGLKKKVATLPTNPALKQPRGNQAAISQLPVVHECICEHEICSLEKYYGKDAKSWETEDGVYRIRYYTTFMGVTIDEGSPYHLLKRKGNDYRPFPKIDGNYFQTLKSALKAIKAT